jgi:hypothetical protein
VDTETETDQNQKSRRKVMKWIKLNDNVITTPTIDRTLVLLDPYFENEPVTVTSGLRTAEKQLEIIAEKVKQHHLEAMFPEWLLFKGNKADVKTKIDEHQFYWWQRSWSKLLNLNDIVNPPLAAILLEDYTKPGTVINKKGSVVDISPHQRGNAFDIGGGTRIHERANIILKAANEKKCFIFSYLVEYVNNAIHINTEPIV